MNSISGARILAKSLKTQGINYVFGIVGIPVVEVAMAIQEAGIKFIGMRNEQAASYAAGAYGYLTKSPGVCLVVSGPGLVHALSGLANAQSNGWPMLLIGGSIDRDQQGLGAFQEFPQVDACRMYSKYTCQPSHLSHIPFHVEKAIRCSTYGRPGGTYIDLTSDIISEETSSTIDYPEKCPDPPVSLTDASLVSRLADTLMNAENPLVIVGKGAAYGKAEKSVRELISKFKLPFLPTPMGKGVVPDDDPHCVSSARSRALLKADVILLLGARLNWILHFGRPPRFNPDVKILQVDLHMEELHNSIRSHVGVFGDVDSVVQQINSELEKRSWTYSSSTAWWNDLNQKKSHNEKAVMEMINDHSVPLNYYAAYNVVQKMIPKDAMIVNEGANTMDIGRTMLPNIYPRHRLDAGTFGTMGVGLGSAIAAAFWCQDNAPTKKVICIQGDSAFGFGAMEMETICRYHLPVIVIIFNNNGIYTGVDKDSWKMLEEDETTHLGLSFPPVSYLPNAHYERICGMFGGKGYFVETISELESALSEALGRKDTTPSVINILIAPYAAKKPQEFPWHTRSKM